MIGNSSSGKQIALIRCVDKHTRLVRFPILHDDAHNFPIFLLYTRQLLSEMNLDAETLNPVQVNGFRNMRFERPLGFIPLGHAVMLAYCLIKLA
ncbi:hypothetical protein D3C73_1324970 [compost metagenome]